MEEGYDFNLAPVGCGTSTHLSSPPLDGTEAIQFPIASPPSPADWRRDSWPRFTIKPSRSRSRTVNTPRKKFIVQFAPLPDRVLGGRGVEVERGGQEREGMRRSVLG